MLPRATRPLLIAVTLASLCGGAWAQTSVGRTGTPVIINGTVVPQQLARPTGINIPATTPQLILYTSAPSGLVGQALPSAVSAMPANVRPNGERADVGSAVEQAPAVEPSANSASFEDLSAGEVVAGEMVLTAPIDFDVASLAAFGEVKQVARLASLGYALIVLQTSSHDAAKSALRLVRERAPSVPSFLNVRYTGQASPRLFADERTQFSQLREAVSGLVRIGMIDTGIQPIPALASAKITQQCVIAGGACQEGSHGTGVAALLVGEDAKRGFYGTARGANLYVANAMTPIADDPNAPGLTNTAQLLKAIDWLISQRVHVVNMSFGGPEDPLLRAAVSKLIKLGISVVAAAGNGGPDAEAVFPAAYPGVIAVTGVDAANVAANSGNQGKYVALAAPGVDVWVPNKTTGRYATGSSFAVPFVTGAIAHMLAYNPRLSTAGVSRLLCDSAKDLGASGRDNVYGCGLVQASNAMAAMISNVATIDGVR